MKKLRIGVHHVSQFKDGFCLTHVKNILNKKNN